MQQSQSNRYSTQSWFTRLSLFVVLCTSFSLGFTKETYVNQKLELHSDHLDSACSVQILNTQVVKADPDLTRAPQNGWQDVKLPDDWDSRWKDYSGSAWYKITWQYHCANNQYNHPFAVLIERITLAGVVYNNNELIWRDKSLIEPLSRSWNMPRYWVLPSSSLKQGKNEILVRVVGLQSQHSGLGHIQIGNVENITNQHGQAVFENRTLYAINLLIACILGMICFLIWIFRRQEVAFGWFAFSCIFWALFIANMIITTPFPFNDSLTLSRFNLVFLLCYTYTFCLFVWRFSNAKFRIMERILAVFTILLSILLIFIPDHHILTVLNISFLSSCIIFILNCLFTQWIAYKKQKFDVYLLAAVFLTFIIIIIHDLVLIMTQNLTALMWTPFSAPITSVAISIILALRISKNMHRIETFNETLKDTVEAVTFDLEQSLDKKYQLEIDNMRLQERLNLSHELHDGLGGSLVRSMILLDHSEKVEKSQVMSMFKLLRNDLRQVIDTGSSIGVKIPTSPVLWVAPLRHRFVQLFEEMDIESTWIFANHWNITPIALHCLTLSRVAEEALTNIIKHSQATDVEVSLTQDAQYRIILEIRDNGIGFVADSVQEGLHVGLQSMQVRVKRIGGDFHISSETGLTVIRAIVPQRAICE